MKVAAILGERQAGLVEKPEPQAWRDLVVVRNQVIPLCTEYRAYAAGKCSDRLGHEAAGEVIEIAQPGRVRVGDRVVVMSHYPCGACRLCLAGDSIYCQDVLDVHAATGVEVGTATYAERMLKTDWMLIPVPDDMSLEHASMACCGIGPTFGAMQRMRVDAFDTVLITGMGPVGLGGVINGLYRGARVLAVETHPYRAELARTLGAEEVFDPADPDLRDRILALTHGEGVTKGIDCSGSPEAQRLLVELTRRRGEVAFVGEGGELRLHVSNDLIRKGLTLHGSWHCSQADTPRLLQVIRSCVKSIDTLITHRFSLADVGRAWDLQLTGNCGKVLLHG